MITMIMIILVMITMLQAIVRSVFKISCLLLRPRPWQFEI